MIKIYTKTACPKCEQVKSYMDGAGIVYEALDITNNPEMLSFIRQVAQGAGFPVVQFEDGKFIAGNVEAIVTELSSIPTRKEHKDFFWAWEEIKYENKNKRYTYK